MCLYLFEMKEIRGNITVCFLFSLLCILFRIIKKEKENTPDPGLAGSPRDDQPFHCKGPFCSQVHLPPGPSVASLELRQHRSPHLSWEMAVGMWSGSCAQRCCKERPGSHPTNTEEITKGNAASLGAVPTGKEDHQLGCVSHWRKRQERKWLH